MCRDQASPSLLAAWPQWHREWLARFARRAPGGGEGGIGSDSFGRGPPSRRDFSKMGTRAGHLLCQGAAAHLECPPDKAEPGLISSRTWG